MSNYSLVRSKILEEVKKTCDVVEMRKNLSKCLDLDDITIVFAEMLAEGELDLTSDYKIYAKDVLNGKG